MSLYWHAKSLFNLFPERWRSAIILGGGCLRAYYDKTTIKDIDCFFRCVEDYQAVKEAMAGTDGYVLIKDNHRCCEFWRTGGYIINLVGFIFGEPHDHLERFDFRCSQFVAWFNEVGILHTECAPEAPTDAQKKLLYIQNNNGTERTLRRIRHYVEDYEYNLHPEQDIEQEDAFEDEFSAFDAHRPQGVHPSDFKAAPPEWLRHARRRVAALSAQPYSYTED